MIYKWKFEVTPNIQLIGKKRWWFGNEKKKSCSQKFSIIKSIKDRFSLGKNPRKQENKNSAATPQSGYSVQ